MTQSSSEAKQRNKFLDIFSKLTSSLKFSMLVYLVESDKMLNLEKGILSDAEVPDSIRPLLGDDKTFCTYINHDSDTIVLYFMRFKIDDRDYVVVIQDNKRHIRLNKFVSVLMDGIFESKQSLSTQQISVPMPVDPTGEKDRRAVESKLNEQIFNKDIALAEKNALITALELQVEEFSQKIKEQNETAEQDAGKSEEASEIVSQQLQKIAELEDQLKRMPELEDQLKRMPELEDQLKRMPELEDQLKRMPELEDQLKRMPELEDQLKRMPELEDQLKRIPELEEQILSGNKADAEKKELSKELQSEKENVKKLSNSIAQLEVKKTELEAELNAIKESKDSVDGASLRKDSLGEDKEAEKEKSAKEEGKVAEAQAKGYRPETDDGLDPPMEYEGVIVQEKKDDSQYMYPHGLSKVTKPVKSKEELEEEQAIKGELERLREEVAEMLVLKARVENKRFSLDSKDEEIVALKAEISQLKTKEDGAEEGTKQDKRKQNLSASDQKLVVNDLMDRLGILEDRSIALQIEVGKKEQMIRDMSEADPATLRALRKEVDDLKSELRATIEKKEKFKVDIEELKSHNEELEEQLKEFKMKMEELGGAIDTQRQYSVKRDGEYDDLNKMYTSEVTELNGKIVEFNNKVAQYEALESELRSTIRKNEAKHTQDLYDKELGYDQKIDDLNTEIAVLREELDSHGVSQDDFEKQAKQLLAKEAEFESLQAELEMVLRDAENSRMEHHEKMTALERSLGELSAELAATAGANTSLAKSSDRKREMLNTVALPMLSVDVDGIITMANSAMLEYSRHNDLSEVIGKYCHDVICDQAGDECAFCKLDEVIRVKKSIQIDTVVNGKAVSITFFPLLSSEGEVLEVVEILEDISELEKLKTVVTDLQGQYDNLKSSKRSNVEEYTELEDRYESIMSEHKSMVDKNNKMLRVIERLVSEDKAKELVSIRTELMESKRKLGKGEELIQSYKKQLEEQSAKYMDLNKRTFYQMERLLGIIKDKTQLRTEETNTILKFLTKEFESMRKYFNENKTRANIQVEGSLYDDIMDSIKSESKTKLLNERKEEEDDDDDDGDDDDD